MRKKNVMSQFLSLWTKNDYFCLSIYHLAHTQKNMSDFKPKGASASSDVSHIRDRNPQNFLLVWVDANINESKLDCQNTLTQLRTVVNNVNLCTTAAQCIQFLQDTHNEKAFLIVSGSLGQKLVPQIHPLSQVDAIYVFCGDKPRHEQWAKDYPKVKGVHTNIEVICKELPIAAKQCNQDSVVVSIVSADERGSDGNINQLEPCFMYTQIFKEILLEMEHDDKSKADLVAHCRAFYQKNEAELKIIDEFEKNYRPQLVIWWYTRECFTYQMLNRALRTLEADTIIKMGFFIRDLHQEIQKLYETQINNYPEKCFTVYRGQGLSIVDFNKLQKSKGGLLSFNSFLSTSKIRKESHHFATNALVKTNTVGILFKMSIDTSVSSAPFAAVEDIAEYHMEKEILFSMHTVFRIGEVNRVDNTKLLYEVDLQLTADDDEQLRNLTEILRKQTSGSTGWRRLGSLLLMLGEFDKAEEVYLVLLEQTTSRREKAVYYNQLGTARQQKSDWQKALEYFQKALDIEEKVLSPDDPSLGATYNNMGTVYRNMREYTKALLCYEKDLQISQKSRPPNHPHTAVLYNNIGMVCFKTGECSKALMFYEKVLAVELKTLPSNHPSLAITYNNIAGVYHSMNVYAEALIYYEKDLAISQQALPSTHPSLAASHANIASLYVSMKKYSKALVHFEHARDIYLSTLSADHPDVRNAERGIKYTTDKLKSDA